MEGMNTHLITFKYLPFHRILTVDVNNILSHISMIEANSDISLADTIEDQNPDCFVLVYAVDDLLSFGKFKNHQ